MCTGSGGLVSIWKWNLAFQSLSSKGPSSKAAAHASEPGSRSGAVTEVTYAGQSLMSMPPTHPQDPEPQGCETTSKGRTEDVQEASKAVLAGSQPKMSQSVDLQVVCVKEYIYKTFTRQQETGRPVCKSLLCDALIILLMLSP